MNYTREDLDLRDGAEREFRTVLPTVGGNIDRAIETARQRMHARLGGSPSPRQDIMIQIGTARAAIAEEPTADGRRGHLRYLNDRERDFLNLTEPAAAGAAPPPTAPGTSGGTAPAPSAGAGDPTPSVNHRLSGHAAHQMSDALSPNMTGAAQYREPKDVINGMRRTYMKDFFLRVFPQFETDESVRERQTAA